MYGLRPKCVSRPIISSLTPRDTTFHTTKRRHCRQRAMCPSRKVMRPLRK